jgi:chlorobactene glucosyltransferase
MIVLALIASVALLGMTGILLSNLVFFPRLKDSRDGAAPVLVSILIPARNEAAVIGDTIRQLLAQTYPRFELILLDDGSTDGTVECARAAASGDDRLRVLPGRPLPAGWAGKNWACQQLGEAARGDVLLFTDADTRWSPGGLTSVIQEMTRTAAHLQTVWPTQITVTWAERLTVPNIALVVVAYLPAIFTHFTPFASFAAANGQVMAFRRAAYDKIGGHLAVRGEVVEDIKLARRIKACGLRLRMADGNRLVSCRMYTGWPSVRSGFAKSIVGGYGSVAGVVVASVFHWIVFLFPWAWLVLGWLGPHDYGVVAGSLSFELPGWPLWPALLALAGLAIRAATAGFTRQRLRDALLMPVSAVLMSIISALACWWQLRFGGPVWKGRVIKQA